MHTLQVVTGSNLQPCHTKKIIIALIITIHNGTKTGLKVDNFGRRQQSTQIFVIYLTVQCCLNLLY